MDDEGITVEIVAERRLVKARKDHRCDDCGEKIPAGSRYWRGFLLVDGEPTTTKTCSPDPGACAYYLEA